MGDNRSKSFDSRNWGAVDRSDIVGIARLRMFPLSEFNIFEPQATSTAMAKNKTREKRKTI